MGDPQERCNQKPDGLCWHDGGGRGEPHLQGLLPTPSSQATAKGGSNHTDKELLTQVIVGAGDIGFFGRGLENPSVGVILL